MAKKGWKINQIIELPEGYELREDIHFLYIYYHDKKVAVFNNYRVTEGAIKKACLEHEDVRWEELLCGGE